MDLRENLERFIVSRQSLARSERTVESYVYHVTKFLTWCAEQGYSDGDLVGVSGAETIEEFMLDQSAAGLSAHTIHGHYRSLRALYRFTDRRHGPIEGGNPFLWLTEPSKPDLLPKAITYADFTLLLHTIKGDNWIGVRDRLIVKTLYETGLRAGELLSLKRADVDLERRLIRVMRSKVNGEGFVPLSKSLADELRAWLSSGRPECGHDGLWPTRERDDRADAPLHYDGLKEVLRRRCERAGLKTYYAHSFRHGCAVHIVQSGGDISLVKDLLGHRDLLTTQVYLRFDQSRLTSMYDKVFR